MESQQEKKRVLAIFAHSDDELGCVGTMKNYVEEGHEVFLTFLTKGENATTVVGNSQEITEKRREHTRKIESLLGVKVNYLDFIDSKVEYSVESGYQVAEHIKEIRPKIIITWNKIDSVGGGHPDHRNCSDIVRDAISYCRYKNPKSDHEPWRETIDFYMYYFPGSPNNPQIRYIDVSDKLEVIKNFIQIYKEAYGDWPVEDFKITSLTMLGRASGVKYAEAFEVVSSQKSASKLFF